MKIFKRIAVLTFFIIVLSFFAGCGQNKLATPSNTVVNDITMTLSWDSVENATNYIVSANNKNYVVSKTSFSLVNLEAGSYELKVKSRNAKGDYSDSKWSTSLHYDRPEENGLEYVLTNANTEYAVKSVGTATGSVEIGAYYNGKPVTSIYDEAFSNSYKITDVKIGDNVKSIGTNAFTNCSNLMSVEFGENVEKIGQYAFQGCRGLKSVVLPKRLSELSGFVFRYCRSLTSVTINDELTDIGEGAFASCDKLTTINIPDSVKKIGKSAFEACSSLESAVIGNGVITIGESAFSGDKSLNTVHFGQSLTTIGNYAFNECVNIQSADLPESLTAINKSAFYGCAALGDVSLKSNVSEIGEYAFYGTKYYEQSEDGVFYVGNWAVGSDKTITKIKFRAGTTGIADGAFRNCVKLISVAIPDEITFLGEYAFSGCTQLSSLSIGAGITTISKCAFQNCTGLGMSNVRINDSVTKIDNYAFYGCKMLGDPSYLKKYPFSLPNNLTEIGTYAFKNTAFWTNTANAGGGGVYIGNWLVGYISGEDESVFNVKEGTKGIANYAFYKSSYLEIVSLPDSLEILGKGAFAKCPFLVRVITGDFCKLKELREYVFYNCNGLQEADIPYGTEVIGKYAFYKSGITSLEIPSTVEEIQSYAFYKCDDLTNIKFAENSSLRIIGEYAFSKSFSWNLATLNLPRDVEVIGDRAFYGCEYLKNIDLGSTISEIGMGAFEGCSSLESVNIPDSVTVIGDRVFAKCSLLKSVDLGSGVTEIGNSAFYKCESLSKITIPSNVVKIGDYAFRNCSLTCVYIPNSVLEAGSHVFNGNVSLTLYVQNGEKPSGWSSRWNSSYRPVIFNAGLSDDGTYVNKLVKTENSILNDNAKNGVSAPEREGYVFVCWKSDSGETYGKDTIINAPNGVTYYAEWREKTPEDEDNATESDETTDSESGNTELSEAA